MRHIFVLVSLMAAWTILVETFNPFFIIAGMAVGIVSLYFSEKYLPLKAIDDVSFAQLISYPFYLIGQIYIGGIYVTKVIFAGERSDVVTIKTSLRSETLRVIMADTITLTPGSILLDLVDDDITVVWLRKKSDPDPELVPNKEALLKGNMEARLSKAESQVDT